AELGLRRAISRLLHVDDDARIDGYRREVCTEATTHLEHLLGQGHPQLVLERTAAFKELRLNCPALAEVELAARTWLSAQELVGRGELGAALVKVESGPWRDCAALANYRRQVQELRDRFTALATALQEAMEQRQWREVIRLADELLVIAPHDPEVRRARSLGWRELEPPTSVGNRPKPIPAPVPATDAHSPSEPVPGDPPPGLPRRFILWIDGVGGFLVCLANRVSIGQAAAADGQVDIPIFADISRLHAYINRDAEGYLFEAFRPATLRGQPVTRTLLRDGDTITLGNHCSFQFHQPIAISTTARLSLPGGQRLPMGLDGIILMADTLLLGETADSHIQVPGLPRPVALLRKKDELFVQSVQDYEVDGVAHRGRCSLLLDSTVSGAEFRFTLEPIGGKVVGVRR
ncbi:MAG TPA: FHA domain-containing protein, partial [Gemmatales bacterium]|nr:FHA domain-containing protein [Gemmatales bacterium]